METLFTSAAGRNHKVYHLDVERAFLNDKLKEDVFLDLQYQSEMREKFGN